MGIHCHITFDQNSLGTFFSGSVVSGKVEISLDRPKKVRGIAIKFAGAARTNWTEEGTKKNNKRETERFYAREDYLSSITYLIGSNNGNTITISPGIQTYTFACALPYQLPSSFEGSWGHVRYSVKIILDRPWKFDQTHCVGITVLKLVDLNYESPVLRMPPQVETNKEFWCGPCATNPLTVRVNLPQTGYVPGQTIFIDADINNATNIQVDGVHFSLRKIIKYHSQHPHRKIRIEVKTIAKTFYNGIIDKRTHQKIQEFIQVPSVPPTCINLCKIIQISYEIQVKPKVHGFHQSPRIMIPIFIGNIPLVSVISQQPRSITDSRQTSLPMVDNISNFNSMNSDTTDLPPPTYEEAVLSKPVNINEDDEHALSRIEYVPRYPVYSFSNRTSTILNPNNVYSENGNDSTRGYRWSEIPSASAPALENNVNNPDKQRIIIPNDNVNQNIQVNKITSKPGTWL